LYDCSLGAVDSAGTIRSIAAKNIVVIHLAILHAEAARACTRKPVEALAKEIHYEPLPSEV
jgi:hypothetical protein